MVCGNCHLAGHNRRRCPLNNRHHIFVIRYALVARRFAAPGGGQIQIQLPNLFHHAIVVNGLEYGYGRFGITIIPPGTFYNHHGRTGYWRIAGYDRLPANFQLGATRRQMAIIVNNLTAHGFAIGNYCCIHRNCLLFCQEVMRQLFHLHHRNFPPILPNELQQYPVALIQQILETINFAAAHFHQGQHQCVLQS